MSAPRVIVGDFGALGTLPPGLARAAIVAVVLGIEVAHARALLARLTAEGLADAEGRPTARGRALAEASRAHRRAA